MPSADQVYPEFILELKVCPEVQWTGVDRSTFGTGGSGWFHGAGKIL